MENNELTSVADYSAVLIESKVLEVEYNEILKNIRVCKKKSVNMNQ